MKHKPLFASVVLAALLLMAAPALAAHHLNGTWVFSITLSDGQGGDATLELEEKEGGELTGSYSGALGQESITGKVDGSSIEISFDSQAGKVTYTAHYQDGKISGECSYGQLGSGTFVAKKKE